MKFLAVSVSIAFIGFSSLVSAAWNPRAAADYLDTRQKDWFEWTGAQGAAGPCMSCHTGMTYLMARPALRRKLGETQATEYETKLVDGLRARIEATTGAGVRANFTKEPVASQAVGVEAIFAALFLSNGPDEKRAFDRLWSLQQGNSWNWFSVNLDPWEMPESGFFGGSMALLATGTASTQYKGTPDFRRKQMELAGWLTAQSAQQPLHNKLTWLWTSASVQDAMSPAMRRSLVNEAFRAQQADGSWTMESLGPWNEHPDAHKLEGSNAYATAMAAYALRKGGVFADDPRLKRALAWLDSHQDARGYWDAGSMNKVYPDGSMMQGFMRDAATGFAVLALTN